MINYIIATMIWIFQVILSINLIIRKKNNFAIASEIISSCTLLIVLKFISKQMHILLLLEIVLAEYLSVKIFLIIFMIIARYYSFYKIKSMCTEKKKANPRELKFIRAINKVEYWPKLKLGIPGRANKTDKKTNVRFDSKGFPIFKSYYTVKLKRKDFRASREKHFYIANKMLYKDKTYRSKIKSKLRRKQIKQLAQGCTPDGYTWHHHQNAGVLQLVNEEIHSKTWHHGGYHIWGGE